MASCARCGRHFDPASPGQFHCAECAREFDVPPPSTPAPSPSRIVPLSFYLASPTIWLIVANILVFIVSCILSRSVVQLDSNTLLRLGANYGTFTLGGQPWRLITCMFLHGGLVHLALNMWALFNLGILAEILFRRRTYLFIYFACGISSSLASVWWHFYGSHISVFGVGASGAIFGVAGALLPALAFQKNARMRVALRGNLTSIAIFVVYSVAFGARAARIDNAAHLGGLALGLLLGFLLPSSPGADTEGHLARRTTVFAGVVILLAFSFAWLQKSQYALIEFSRAREAYSKHDFPAAIQHLDLSIQRDPNLVDPHYVLGIIYLEQKKNDLARQQLTTATRLQPDYANAFEQLCIADLRLADLTAALTACRRSVELDDHDPDKFFNLGLTQRASKDLNGAVESFRKASQLKPTGADEVTMFALTLVEVGRTDEAVEPLQRAIRLNPRDPNPRNALIYIYRLQGRSDEANELLNHR